MEQVGSSRVRGIGKVFSSITNRRLTHGGVKGSNVYAWMGHQEWELFMEQ